MSSLSQWLHYIETLHPKTMDLGLDRVRQVAEKLHVVEFSCPVITIGGTNGKGSCVAFLQAILSAAGYKVGSYTSPHLLHFNERIKINNIPIDDASLCEAFQVIEEARGALQLTYFEFTTLAALWLFKKAPLDALLLEVGLGGRLDAVNIVDSDMAIITTIALDHTEWLGKDRESIGFEKSGIFRANKPAICGDFDPPQSVFQAAQRLGTTLYSLNRDFSYQRHPDHWSLDSPHRKLPWLPIPQLPMQNAATALMALHFLDNIFTIQTEHIEQGLINANVPGRFQQRVYNSIPTILDVAHNPASAQLLAQRLSEQPCQGQTLVVVSILADKDIKNTLMPLLACVNAWFVCTLPVPRGCSSSQISQYLQEIGAEKCYNYDSVEDAYHAAQKQATQADRIVVYGSFHTVAAVIQTIKKSVRIPGLDAGIHETRTLSFTSLCHGSRRPAGNTGFGEKD